MNRQTFPGVICDKSTPIVDLFAADKNHIATAIVLGDMRKDVGEAIISYIDKYTYYVQN